MGVQSLFQGATWEYLHELVNGPAAAWAMLRGAGGRAVTGRHAGYPKCRAFPTRVRCLGGSDRRPSTHPLQYPRVWGVLMKKIIVGVAAGALVIGCADVPSRAYTVRDEETAIRIGVGACMSVTPPRNELHAEYRAGTWRVWWGDKKGLVFTFTVNVDAATGAAGLCTVGTS